MKDEEQFSRFSSGVESGRKGTCRACESAIRKIRSQLKKKHQPPPPGPCPICNDYTTSWVLDHCHTSLRFRGHICNSCNLALGRFKDDPAIVKAALDYLYSSTSQYGPTD